MDTLHIRNFSIVAHIDHGKSTLADRILEFTGVLSLREKKDQFLDQMELERERGITIKASPVRLNYRSKSGEDFVFNLIDTPGHVDFSYEVSRSLAACEGALLVVDATQGVEAQTLANAYLAIDNNLELIPVINKIDLPGAEPERVRKEIEDIIGIDASGAILASAKEGTGIEEILESVVTHIPQPKGDPQKPLSALLFDSWYDSYQGVIMVVRVFDGSMKLGDRIRIFSTGRSYEVTNLAIFAPYVKQVQNLSAGDVGVIIAGIKDLHDTNIGDTITLDENPVSSPLPGFKQMKPMVFAGIYPVENNQYESLKAAIEKLRLNDASFTSEPETSSALGFGFRCGFLGLLHKEIIQERLEREYELSLISTAPTVAYKIYLQDGKPMVVENPANFPENRLIENIEEPYVKVTIHIPSDYVGAIMKMCEDKRGIQREMKFLTRSKVMLVYELPLSEIISDFYDKLKSLSRGYASMEYEFLEYRKSELIKLNILINGEPVDALSLIVHKDNAYYRGRALTERLRKVIPRQLFDVAIQAAIGSRIIAKESVRAMRKDVLAKCYGGDITRKRKLLEKQKEGKKRMKHVGAVNIPQEAFLAVLKTD
ncbi:MAG: translation elongation factor 4 [Deltaproteobacteria bacterium]|nr:translation elongation factor 4 [Deltaproteobacteria bacterium]MCL5792378.1 translation elongation factor 4 [Deltaproteobacteria bacterium]